MSGEGILKIIGSDGVYREVNLTQVRDYIPDMDARMASYFPADYGERIDRMYVDNDGMLVVVSND